MLICGAGQYKIVFTIGYPRVYPIHLLPVNINIKELVPYKFICGAGQHRTLFIIILPSHLYASQHDYNCICFLTCSCVGPVSIKYSNLSSDHISLLFLDIIICGLGQYKTCLLTYRVQVSINIKVPVPDRFICGAGQY